MDNNAARCAAGFKSMDVLSDVLVVKGAEPVRSGAVAVLAPKDNILYVQSGLLYKNDIYNNYTNNVLKETASKSEDLEYGDKTKDQLTAMKWITWMDFLVVSERDYINSWEYLARTLSVGEMQGVVLDMINHFCSGTGNDYKNATLTKYVKDDSVTSKFINDFTAQLKNELESIGGGY